MAEVFEAELAGELGFARKIAIKRMLGDAAADPRALQRFLDEARIASRLHHASIVAIFDVGLLDDLPFQVLELVDGLNAQQLLQRAGGRLPLEVALAVASEAAHALAYAHAATDDAGASLGVVHRDVKPSNILVSWAGDVKLADFGIAIARDRAARTETGAVAGTFGFMAPEQRMGWAVDGRADVFALGLTLHALVTGATPLQDLAVELAVIDGRPIPLDPDLPEDVRRLIARAVAPARLDRPSAAELAAALGAALAPRLVRDARGVLRDFVEPLGARRPAAGALDHLLGIEVVPDAPVPGGAAPGEPPRYRTVAAAAAPFSRPADVTVRKPDVAAPTAPRPPPLPPAVSPSPTRSSSPPPSESPSPTRSSSPLRSPSSSSSSSSSLRGRRVAALALAAFALAAGGLGVWRLAAGGGTGAPPAVALAPATDAAVLAPATDAAALAPTLPDAAPAPLAAASARPDAGPAAPAATPPRRAATPPRPAATPPRPAATPPRPEVAAPAETGWLLVYGDELVGARVSVDAGKWTGSVPNAIEVAVGRRSVAVVRRDGTQLPPKQVDVTSFHSSMRPLRITW